MWLTPPGRRPDIPILEQSQPHTFHDGQPQQLSAGCWGFFQPIQSVDWYSTATSIARRAIASMAWLAHPPITERVAIDVPSPGLRSPRDQGFFQAMQQEAMGIDWTGTDWDLWPLLIPTLLFYLYLFVAFNLES